MNFDIWGPSHGLCWSPYRFDLVPSASRADIWEIWLKCDYYWLSHLFPIGGPLAATPTHAWFDDFEFYYPGPPVGAATNPPWLTEGIPAFRPVDLTDSRYLAWLLTPEGNQFDSVDFTNQWERIHCNNDPSDLAFTDGHLVLSLGFGIDLTPLFPMAFTLDWPACPTLFPLRGPGWKPPIPGLGISIDAV